MDESQEFLDDAFLTPLIQGSIHALYHVRRTESTPSLIVENLGIFRLSIVGRFMFNFCSSEVCFVSTWSGKINTSSILGWEPGELEALNKYGLRRQHLQVITRHKSRLRSCHFIRCAFVPQIALNRPGRTISGVVFEAFYQLWRGGEARERWRRGWSFWRNLIRFLSVEEWFHNWWEAPLSSLFSSLLSSLLLL